MKYVTYLVLLFILFISSCQEPVFLPAEQLYTVGFSQPNTNDLWRKTMNDEMRLIAGIYPEINLQITDADYEVEQQILDIQQLLEMGVDLLIVSPIESEPLVPVIERVYEAGIPVILIDRKINSSKFTSYIGGDNKEIGRLAAEYLNGILNEGDSIAEIHGMKGSTPAQERHQGFMDHLNKDLVLTEVGDARWQEDRAKDLMLDFLEKNEIPSAIYAHNDAMALGAYNSVQNQNLQKDIIFIGVDALIGKGAGVDLVKQGILDATFLYPSGAKEAIENALKILRGEDVPKNILLGTVLIDQENAELYEMQYKRMTDQQNTIREQQEMINNQLVQFSNQRLRVIGLSIFAFLMLLSVWFLVKSYDKIEALNEQLAESNNELDAFAHTVAHDLKQPINGITGLSLLAKELVDSNDSEDLMNAKDVITKIHSSSRKLREITESLLTFAEINRTESIQFEAVSLEEVVKESMRRLETTIAEKDADIVLLGDNWPNVAGRKLWVEEMIVNYLSNALKYGGEKPRIELSYENQLAQNKVKFYVRDFGKGLDIKDTKDLFSEFKTDVDKPGHGLGLSIVKRIASRLHGEVGAENADYKGSVFWFKLSKHS